MPGIRYSDTEPGLNATMISPSHNAEKTDLKARPKTPSVYDSNHKSKSQILIVEDVISRPDVNLASFADLDIRKINRKIDLRLVPVIMLLNFLSFLDRTAIGNARIQGMEKDLGLSGGQFNIAMTVFFFTYSLFEIPSNFVLKRLRPSIWLPAIMVSWGIVTTLTGLVHNYGGLLTVRLCLGMTEAGLVPGVAYYLTMWYPRYEVQSRQAYFFTGVTLASGVGGFFAFAIEHMDGVGGLASWRWLFIIEGIISVVAATVAYLVMYDFPATAKFLTPAERAFVAYRLKYDGMNDGVDGSLRVPQTDQKGWKYAKPLFTDVKVYLLMISQICFVATVYGVSLSMPKIIKAMGYKTTTAQLMTMPPYFTAAAVTVGMAYACDHYKSRIPFILGCYTVAIVGFGLCVSGGPPHRTYAGIFVAACGIFPVNPCVLALTTNNLAGEYKRAIGLPFILMFAVFGGAIASNFFRTRDAPKFVFGFAMELGASGVGCASLILVGFLYARANRDRERRCAAGEHRRYTVEELSEQGDKAVTFRYTI